MLSLSWDNRTPYLYVGPTPFEGEYMDPSEHTADTTSSRLSPTGSLSATVVEAVASHLGCEPDRLQPPLYDVLDPEALDELFRRDHGTTGYVRFEYRDLEIRVNSDGTVEISSLSHEADR